MKRRILNISAVEPQQLYSLALLSAIRFFFLLFTSFTKILPYHQKECFKNQILSHSLAVSYGLMGKGSPTFDCSKKEQEILWDYAFEKILLELPWWSSG